MVPRPLFLLSDTLLLVFVALPAVAVLAERLQVVYHRLSPS